MTLNPSKDKRRYAGFVRDVAARYLAGATAKEIATELQCGSTTVQRALADAGVPSRRCGTRDQSGPRNHQWAGSKVGYNGAHRRLQQAYGAPRRCEHCQTTTAKTYDWANISGRYAEMNDYVRLCRSCHWKFDGTGRNFGNRPHVRPKRKEMLRVIRLRAATGQTA